MRRELVLMDICSKSAIGSLRGSASCKHVIVQTWFGLYFISGRFPRMKNASNPGMGGFIGDKEFIGTFQRIFRAEPRSSKTGVHNPRRLADGAFPLVSL